VSDGYDTPRWDDDEVPELGATPSSPASEEAAEDDAGSLSTGSPADAALDDPWERAARETRAGEASDAEDVDRSSENVLASWPASTPEAEESEALAPVSDAAAEERPSASEGWSSIPPSSPPAEEAGAPTMVAAGLAGEPEGASVEAAVEAAVIPEGAPPELGSTTAEHAPGELVVPPGFPLLEGVPRGERRAVGIVVSRFNGDVTTKLLDGALTELADLGVASEAITVMPVPGAFELPLAAMALAKTRRFSCIVALGCVIRGDTPHFEYVASEAASGVQLAAIETGVPVAFGVLTLDSADQAASRLDKGAEAVRTALEMADVFANLRAAAAR
jgi:6,7-dimethyl-8-ribityllumazine synthase